MIKRLLFVAVVFSALSMGCEKNQFTPASGLATLYSQNKLEADSFSLAEDGEYQIITAESRSSGGNERSAMTPKTAVVIPREVFEDHDFGSPRADNSQDDQEQDGTNADLGTLDDGEPAEPKEGDESALLILDTPKDSDIAFTSHLRPTVYYFPVINEDLRKCEKDYILRDEEGEKMLSLCEKTRASCRLQGSCAIIQNGKKRTFNIIGNFDGKDRFFETSKNVCRFGFGVKSSCLDPFYTVAADLAIYRPGDVIYVPVVRGVELPDGSKHSGYFLVRDTGRNIKGKARFDFFSGHISWRDDLNPFSNVGLSNKANSFRFMKIKGAKAKAFSLLRSYPKLPLSSADQ